MNDPLKQRLCRDAELLLRATTPPIAERVQRELAAGVQDPAPPRQLAARRRTLLAAAAAAVLALLGAAWWAGAGGSFAPVLPQGGGTARAAPAGEPSQGGGVSLPEPLRRLVHADLSRAWTAGVQGPLLGELQTVGQDAASALRFVAGRVDRPWRLLRSALAQGR